MSLPARRTRVEEPAVIRMHSGCCSRPTAPASVRAGPSRCPQVSPPQVIPYAECPETASNTGACTSHIAAAPHGADLLKQTSGTPDFAREPSDGLRGIRHRTSEETRLLHTGLGLRVGLTPGEVGRGSRGRCKRRVGRMDTHRREPFACKAAGTHRTHVRVPDPLRSASQDKPSGFVTPQPLLIMQNWLHLYRKDPERGCQPPPAPFSGSPGTRQQKSRPPCPRGVARARGRNVTRVSDPGGCERSVLAPARPPNLPHAKGSVRRFRSRARHPPGMSDSGSAGNMERTGYTGPTTDLECAP